MIILILINVQCPGKLIKIIIKQNKNIIVFDQKIKDKSQNLINNVWQSDIDKKKPKNKYRHHTIQTHKTEHTYTPTHPHHVIYNLKRKI